MKSLYKLVLVLLVLALVLVGCQTGAPTEVEETEEATEEATEVATEEAAPYEGLVVSGECEEGGGTLIQEIRAVDEFTVQFTLCRPDPAFLSKAAFVSFAVQPAEYIEASGGTGDLLEHPIGTGPYMFDAWNRGESIVMTAFPDYWGDPAIAETLVFRWNSEAAARLTELQAGQVDGIDNIGPEDFETVAGDANLQLLERAALNIFYVGITNTFAPFDNPQVRQAVAMGIDRQRIVDEFYPPGSEVASHFTPCAIPNGCTGDEWYEFDPEAARALLAEAGYPDGFATTLRYRDVVRSYLPEPGRVAEELQLQLRENLGIDVTIEVMESGAFIEASSAGSLDGLHLLGWGADYPHITNFLDAHFSENLPQFGNTHPEIFEVLVEGGTIADPAAAESLYAEANNAVRELVPMIPVAHGGSGLAYLADVTGAHASPLGNEKFAGMDPGGRDTFVWMQNAEPISLYCADETDGESLRACEQMLESLMAYEVGGTAVEPALATACEPNDDLTVWTCTLREGVLFHDGSSLDANDVVMSWAVQWDASNPLHVGNSGAFTYWTIMFNDFINAPE